MSQQSSTGKLIVTVIAVTGVVLWKLFKPKKPVQKRQEVKVYMKKTKVDEAQRLHEGEMRKLVGTISADDLGALIKYMKQLENALPATSATRPEDRITTRMTFLLMLRNRAYATQTEQHEMVFKGAAEAFPDDVASMSTNLSEITRKFCNAAAIGVSKCLANSLTVVYEEELIEA